MPHLLSVNDLGRAGIERILGVAAAMRDEGTPPTRISRVGLLFFEDSLRTRVGFEAAASLAGASTSVIVGPKQSEAMRAPEQLDDAVRSIDGWFDVLVLRHPNEGAVRRVAALSSAPVVNAGNGIDEHPTQALVDLFAIRATCGTLDGLAVGLVGDLHGMRSAHSLAFGLAHAGSGAMRAMSPPSLELPARCVAALTDAAWTVDERSELDLTGLDVVYVAGLPAETAAGVLSREAQARLRLTSDVVAALPSGASILCPLPRVDEIDRAVDQLPQARYFDQSRGGLWVRAAALQYVTGD